MSLHTRLLNLLFKKKSIKQIDLEINFETNLKKCTNFYKFLIHPVYGTSGKHGLAFYFWSILLFVVSE